MSQSEIETKKQLEKIFARAYGETNSRFSVVWASLLLGALYLAHRYLDPAWLAEPRRMLFQSGWVPYGIVWWCLLGLHYLWQIYGRRLLPLQQAAIHEQDVIQTARRSGLDSRETYKILVERDAEGRRGYFTQRFLRLFNLYHTNPDLSAV